MDGESSPKKEKKKILTKERGIFIGILLVLLISVIVFSGPISKITSNVISNLNPSKEFVFNWENSTANTFVNSELTPYCEDMPEEALGLEYKNLDRAKICGDQDLEKGDPPLFQYILKFKDESSAYASIEKLKAQIIGDDSFKEFYLIENEDQNIYAGNFIDSSKEKYAYLWNVNSYTFLIMGSETFKTKKLTQWIIEQYTGKFETSLNKTKEIYTLSCGDGKCSSGINEDCNSCSKDCSCQYNTQCVKKDYGEGYECKISQGNYCSWDNDCVDGYCVHNYCRSKSTYCGDNYCDQYDSENPENCGNCPQDCGGSYTQQCVDGELKTVNEYSCSWANDCVSSNCVHGICRSSSTYCGDGWCDYPENKDNCWSDCY